MKFILTTFFALAFILLPSLSNAQEDLTSIQQTWVQTLQSGESTSDFYWEDRNLIYAKIQTKNTQLFSETIKSGATSGIKSYQHEKTFEHDPARFITVGILETKSESNALVTGWRKADGDWKKEIDIILTLSENLEEPDLYLSKELDAERKKWVELANQHNPENHIQQSYTEDATYFGNGQKSDGRIEIAERYFYMENPNYQVDLVKENLWTISESYILEIGRYFTGPDKVGAGGLYIILWETQEDNSWKIELDFNF